MQYVCASKKLAVAVLKALPTSKNLAKDILSDPDALISEVSDYYSNVSIMCSNTRVIIINTLDDFNSSFDIQHVASYAWL